MFKVVDQEGPLSSIMSLLLSVLNCAKFLTEKNRIATLNTTKPMAGLPLVLPNYKEHEYYNQLQKESSQET